MLIRGRGPGGGCGGGGSSVPRLFACGDNLVIGFELVGLVNDNVFVPNLFDIDTDQITVVFLCCSFGSGRVGRVERSGAGAAGRIVFCGRRLHSETGSVN
jgi:hypothetical protein